MRCLQQDAADREHEPAQPIDEHAPCVAERHNVGRQRGRMDGSGQHFTALASSGRFGMLTTGPSCFQSPSAATLASITNLGVTTAAATVDESTKAAVDRREIIIRLALGYGRPHPLSNCVGPQASCDCGEEQLVRHDAPLRVARPRRVFDYETGFRI
jgi:hypothetical protein